MYDSLRSAGRPTLFCEFSGIRLSGKTKLYWLRATTLRVRATINSQILRVEAPARQGAKVQEHQAYSELSQRSQAGCIGAKNVKLFLREP